MVRPTISALPASRIREVANAGIGRSDVLKFWFGEGDRATPPLIRTAAIAALEAGDTFYNHNLGLAELRAALAAYLTRLHAPRAPIGAERIAVTSAGVNALMLIAQALCEPGDRVAIVTPVWPNLTAIPAIMGARVQTVPLSARAGRWTLDLQRLLDAARPGTRMVLVNSPNNPTGWTLPQADWALLRAHCARHGIWLVADDAYDRLVYDADYRIDAGGGAHAPGLLGTVDPDERFISANTFSKSWSMTGWRLGWVVASAAFIQQLGKLIEFNTSCAPPFVQRAGLVALEQGEPLVAETVARLRAARDRLVAQLGAIEGIEVAPPPGAIYAFLRVRGATDSLQLAKRLVAEAGLGLAPGAAFGPEGEGWLRWCYAASDELIDAGVQRLADFMRRDGAG